VAEEENTGGSDAPADDAVKRVDDRSDEIGKVQSMMKIVYILLGVNVLALVGIGAFVFSKLSKNQGQVTISDVHDGESAHGEEAKAGGDHGGGGEHGEPGAEATAGASTFLKESFTVNLADPGRSHFAKVDVDIEVADDFVKTEVTRLIPKIRDFIVIVLSSKTYDQINTVDGKDFLREEIRNKINGYLSRGQIKNVYFSQFIIQ
jgi:flagellar protein FliL